MSYRLHRKTRPQADVEIYGGPLKQNKFDGGMNIDSPASEIKANELAYAANVICFEDRIEPRPGTVVMSASDYSGTLTSGGLYAYGYNPYGTGNLKHIINKGGGALSYFPQNPSSASYVVKTFTPRSGSPATLSPLIGDKFIPYKRGLIYFGAGQAAGNTYGGILYIDEAGGFSINSPNPIHGLKNAGSGANNYRYLFTLSRIITYNSDASVTTAATDRQAAGAEVIHESGSNGSRYVTGGVSTARSTDYGDAFVDGDISVGNPFTVDTASMRAAFGSVAAPTNNSAASHFTHVSIYRTLDISDDGILAGNSKAIYVWVADVTYSSAGSDYSDTISDEILRNRIASQNLILKTQGFQPIPNGDCGEIAGGWLFVSDRGGAVSPSTVLSYCAIGASPENIGYYMPGVQTYRYADSIKAMKANSDILSVFCSKSSHIVNLTAVNNDLSKTQYVPFLTYFQTISWNIGIIDWGTLAAIDNNNFIAVCSDGSVRTWDTNRWGPDLAADKVSSEIKKIIPAITIETHLRGSVGRFYKGAYYLWYSKDKADLFNIRCLRYGYGEISSKTLQPEHNSSGFGWTFYTGFIQLSYRVGAETIVDSNGITRLIAIDLNTGKFNWIETFDTYTGALENSVQMARIETDGGTYSSAGTEITSTIKFRELIASEESNYLVHDETFNRFRPFTEGVAYRTAFSLSFSAYKDGSATAAETITKQSKTASVKFESEIAARRVQLGFSTLASGWRYVGVESHFRALDRINYATAGDNSSSESTTAYPQHQAAFASGMTHWITRREYNTDRATGTRLTESGSGTVSLVVGPDLKSDSAHHFAADGAQYSEVAANSYSGDFAFSFWVHTPPLNKDVFRIAGTHPFYVQFSSNTVLQVPVDEIGDGAAISSVASGWHHFVITRVSGTVYIYQNGSALSITYSDTETFGGGNLAFGYPSGIGDIYSFRAYTNSLTAANIAYYYNNVLAGGDGVEPMV